MRLGWALSPIITSENILVPNQPTKPVRPWRMVAEELSRERDPKRVLELSHELNEALQQQQMELPTDGHKSTR
jgi:hypothetical protein